MIEQIQLPRHLEYNRHPCHCHLDHLPKGTHSDYSNHLRLNLVIARLERFQVLLQNADSNRIESPTYLVEDLHLNLWLCQDETNPHRMIANTQRQVLVHELTLPFLYFSMRRLNPNSCFQ